jgi:signal transduction histidine kinase
MAKSMSKKSKGYTKKKVKSEATYQQLNAQEQQLKAANQQLRASEEDLKQTNHNLGERIKELHCLYGLSQLAERGDIGLDEIFHGLAELIPPGWQYPEITAARITFEGHQLKTSNFRKSAWIQSADLKVHGQKAGSIEVCYLKKMPVIDEGPFLKEERSLLNALTGRMGRIIERKQAEEEVLNKQEQLRALACRLSSIEEEERRHIAEGIHDSVLQPLVFLDVTLGTLLNAAKDNKMRETFKQMRTMLVELIEISRAFTYDLSSPILYELGLEIAIEEWLQTEIKDKHKIGVEFRAETQTNDLDHSMITFLFKSVKELLINVVKHAHANKVKISIARKYNNIILCIEDDGGGFDYDSHILKHGKLSGFGLFNIREQLTYLGGNFNVQSTPGVGSEVVLTVPLESKD